MFERPFLGGLSGGGGEQLADCDFPLVMSIVAEDGLFRSLLAAVGRDLAVDSAVSISASGVLDSQPVVRMHRDNHGGPLL